MLKLTLSWVLVIIEAKHVYREENRFANILTALERDQAEDLLLFSSSPSAISCFVAFLTLWILGPPRVLVTF